MTKIELTALETILGGYGPVDSGTVSATYWAGNEPYLSVVGDEVRFPSEIKVQVIDGATVPLDMVPTRGVCCVRWVVRDHRSGHRLTRYTTIPDVASIDFGALVTVDPATFEPSESGQAAWDEAVAAAQAAVAGAVAARDASATARGAAEDAAVVAVDSAAVAVGAVVTVETARDQAVTAASDATGAKVDAEAARDQSVAAAERAEAVPAQVDTAMADQVGTGGEFDTKLNATIGELAVTNEGGTFGAELVTNGSFATNLSGWTGPGWAWSAAGATHTPGSVSPLIQSAATATPGVTYLVEFNVTRTAGSVVLYFGGTSWPTATSGEQSVWITATTTDALRVTPTTDFAGSVTGISARVLESANARIDSSTRFTKPLELESGRVNTPRGTHIAIGYQALENSSTGVYNIPSSNIAIGYRAGRANTEGHVTAVGYRAGEANTGTGVLTAFGKWAGMANTTGHTTVFGNAAGMSNTTGNVDVFGDEAGADNTTGELAAFGYYAAHTNVDGNVTAFGHQAADAVGPSSTSTVMGYQAGQRAMAVGLTAVGYQAAQQTTSGRPTAIGHEALRANDASSAVAVGFRAGTAKRSGHGTFLGFQAGYAATTGVITAVGASSAMEMTTGNGVFVGHQAGYGTTAVNAPKTDTLAVLIGDYANRSVPSATFLEGYVGIGYGALVGASNTVAIGRAAVAGHSESVALGRGAETVAANQVMIGDRNLESTRTGGTVTLKSPDGTRYKIGVANGGTLEVTAA